MKLRAVLAAVLALGSPLGLSACIGFGALQPASPVAVDAGRTARLVSAFRAQNRLAGVRVDSRLTGVATAQALAMAERDKMGHFVAGSLSKRVTKAGYDWGATAENLGRGYPTLEAAVAGWEASAGHRRNLLNRDVTEIGIGAAVSATRHTYWALVLASPRPQRLQGGGGPLAGAGPFGMDLTQ